MDNKMNGIKDFKKHIISEDQRIRLLIESISKHGQEMSTFNLRIASEDEEIKEVSLMDAVSNLHLHRETSPFYIQFAKLNRNQSNPFMKLVD